MRSLLYLLFIFTLSFVPFHLRSQSLDKEVLRFGYLDHERTENLEITRERIFEGPGLYGFMNGGAELFLEYGFQQLLEQRLIYQGISFIAEYYLMDSPQNAYGIYSVHTFKCNRIDERFQFECLSNVLLQLYHGYLYINLKCLDRSVDAQPLLDSLAEMILSNNLVTENELILPPKSFPAPYSGTLYYVCGDLGLSSAYIGWVPLLAPYSNYSMWLRIDPKTQEASAQIRFASIEDMESFCLQNDNQLEIIILDASIVNVSKK